MLGGNTIDCLRESQGPNAEKDSRCFVWTHDLDFCALDALRIFSSTGFQLQGQFFGAVYVKDGGFHKIFMGIYSILYSSRKNYGLSVD